MYVSVNHKGNKVVSNASRGPGLKMLLSRITKHSYRFYSLINTNFCVQFRITLKSTRSQCHGRRKSLIMQLNSRPVYHVETSRPFISPLTFFGHIYGKFMGFF